MFVIITVLIVIIMGPECWCQLMGLCGVYYWDVFFCESLGYIRVFGSRGVGVSAVVISAGHLLAGFLVWLRG